MEEAEKELERRSKFLSNLIQKKKANDQQLIIRLKASDMPTLLQNKAFKCAKDHLYSINSSSNGGGFKIDSKGLALALKKTWDHVRPMRPRFYTWKFTAKTCEDNLRSLFAVKEFDTSYGPAWHCIVGTSFGSYVTHSLGGFLYFSINKVYVLLFKTAIEPMDC